MARERTPAVTLGAYGAVLAVVFVAALGVGRAVGPIGDGAPHGGTTHGPSAGMTSDDSRGHQR